MATAVEANKTLVRRFFAAIEQGEFQVFDAIVAEDYDDHLAGQSRGRETLKQHFIGLRAALAGLKLPISAIVAEGDKVAVLSRVRGWHTGGRKIDTLTFQLYRIENGQLAEHWEVADFSTLMHASEVA